MQKGQNQSMTRDINLSLIMRSFIKRPMSRVDISRTFRLSKPAASKITAELEALRLICPGKEEAYPNTPGIKPLNYGLNPKLGVITIIDLSSVTVKIQVYNFRGTILAETCVPDMELIRYDDLVRFTEILQALLDKPELSEYALLSLCVALPCAINKQSDSVEWSPRFDIDPA
ncbi:MAG: hypothetical protein LBS99_05315, partial [Clostridiales bacterium]|nr:hypothetical protein [Clostridiales bacterium]